jgi:hypothetical protein
MTDKWLMLTSADTNDKVPVNLALATNMTKASAGNTVIHFGKGHSVAVTEPAHVILLKLEPPKPNRNAGAY